jgi:hypothetical protein
VKRTASSRIAAAAKQPYAQVDSIQSWQLLPLLAGAYIRELCELLMMRAAALE